MSEVSVFICCRFKRILSGFQTIVCTCDKSGKTVVFVICFCFGSRLFCKITGLHCFYFFHTELCAGSHGSFAVILQNKLIYYILRRNFCRGFCSVFTGSSGGKCYAARSFRNSQINCISVKLRNYRHVQRQSHISNIRIDHIRRIIRTVGNLCDSRTVGAFF